MHPRSSRPACSGRSSTGRGVADPAGDDVRVSLCGLGEPLLNRHVVDYIRQVREAGFSVVMSSNGSLLDERRAAALLVAGLQQILINVGEEGDDYEEVYQLPFERTCENVVRFDEMSDGRLRGRHRARRPPARPRAPRPHVTSTGATTGSAGSSRYEIMNRGGALFVDHMQYEHYPELAEARALLAAARRHPAVRRAVRLPVRRLRRPVLPVLLRLEEADAAGQRLRQVLRRCRAGQARPASSPATRCAAPATSTRSTASPRSSAPRRAAKRRRGPPMRCWRRSPPDNSVVEGVLQQLGLQVPAAPPARRLIPVRGT